MTIKNTPYESTPKPMPGSSPLPTADTVITWPAITNPVTSLGSRIRTAASDFWFWLTAPRWHIVVLCLDKIDQRDKAEKAVNEFGRFLKQESRFYLKATYLTFNDPHGYTGPSPEDRYDLHWSALPQKWLDEIPDCDAVMALYALHEKLPIHAGSTWALRDGLMVRGKRRCWAAIPTDLWFYNDTPIDLFKYWKGQIFTHEGVNTIRGTAEADPYYCALSDAPGLPPWAYEVVRVRLEDVCKLGLT